MSQRWDIDLDEAAQSIEPGDDALCRADRLACNGVDDRVRSGSGGPHAKGDRTLASGAGHLRPIAAALAIAGLLVVHGLVAGPVVRADCNFVSGTLAVDAANAAAGSKDGYTITITAGCIGYPVQVASITDTLATGFAYAAGSTTGLTTGNPATSVTPSGGQQLKWTGPWTVPGYSTVSLHFEATVASTPGTYYDSASADAGTYGVIGVGNVQPVLVTAAVPTPTVAPTPTPARTAVPTPKLTPRPSATPARTPAPSSPPTSTPTLTPTPEPSLSATPAASAKLTAGPTPEASIMPAASQPPVAPPSGDQSPPTGLVVAGIAATGVLMLLLGLGLGRRVR
jgi:hypothetical protein